MQVVTSATSLRRHVTMCAPAYNEAMGLRRDAHSGVALVALLGAALMVAPGCGGPSSPSPVEPAPGATPVRGTERLAWSQAGDVSGLRFRAYVDDRPIALDAASCDRSSPAACSSPLPPLTDGVHTIALSNVSTSGLESSRTDPITVQKVSARAVVSAASFPDASARQGSLRLDTVVTMDDGQAFAVDVVTRGLLAPAQLAWLPDGRLLVAEASGLVRVVRPGQPDRGEPALDAHALLRPAPVGALGLAGHPDFLQNHFVYVSFLAQDRPDRTVLRVVRLREVGDTLGEPATLFETPVTPLTLGAADPNGPRLAFGPDGLLYVALPLGVEFDGQPAASRPFASMLRLSDDGRVPSVGPLTGVSAHPLGFTWHPSTGALWVAFPGENGEAALRPITAARTSGVAETEQMGLRIRQGAGPSSGAWIAQRTEAGALSLARAFAAAREQSTGTLRLTVPILPEGLLAGVPDRVGDVVVGSGGTLFLATNNAERAGASGAGGEDVIVRLTPRAPVKPPQ